MDEDSLNITPVPTTSLVEYITQHINSDVIDTLTEDSTDLTETIDMSMSDFKLEKETYTTFDYFSHLYDYRRQTTTSRTIPNSCKDGMAVDDFVELLKKKLSNDLMIKDLLSYNKSAINSNAESSLNDYGVAAFVDRVYSKKEPSTTRKTVPSDYVNSTFLVDLIEAVIFRNGGAV